MTRTRSDGGSRPDPSPAATTGRQRRPSFGPFVRLRFRSDAPLTEALFAALAAENGDFRMERTARGDLELLVPAGSEGGRRNSELGYQLAHWARHEGRGLGVVFDPSGGFTLPNGAVRSPDAAWVAAARWEALTPVQRRAFAPLCPDFVVELRSDTDRPSTLRKKMREYRDHGARLGWLIDPLRRVVEIYRTGRAVEILNNPSSLSGEEVLPGFVLELRELFEP